MIINNFLNEFLMNLGISSFQEYLKLLFTLAQIFMLVAEAKFSGNSLLYNYICMTNCVIIS